MSPTYTPGVSGIWKDTTLLPGSAERPASYSASSLNSPGRLSWVSIKASAVTQTSTQNSLLARPVVLNLWVVTPLGGRGIKQPFHRGHISDVLRLRYLYYDS
ncbi:hypothetical protein ACRRTK_018060 [Alexandromys fortis]